MDAVRDMIQSGILKGKAQNRLPDGYETIQDTEVYEAPSNEPGQKYGVTCDPAGYGETGDPTAIHVIHFNTGNEVASWSGRTDPEGAATRIKLLQQYYGVQRTRIYCESNHGQCIAIMVAWRMKGLYYYNPHHPGVHSNAQTNDDGLTAMVEMLRKRWMLVRSMESLTQVASWDGKARTKRSKAEEGTHHYDRAVAVRLAAWAARHDPWAKEAHSRVTSPIYVGEAVTAAVPEEDLTARAMFERYAKRQAPGPTRKMPVYRGHR